MTNLHNYHDFALMIPAFFSLLQGIILVSTAVSSCQVFGGFGGLDHNKCTVVLPSRPCNGRRL